MPIYEYQCRTCGHYLDALQKLSDPLLTDCPACGKAALRRLVSAPNFRLKGKGWYETDFKSANRRNLAEGGEGDKAEKADKAGKEKAKTDDKKGRRMDESPKQDGKMKKTPDKPAKKTSGDDKAA